MSCGNRNPCKKCNQGINIPTCTTICDFEVPSNCVKIDVDIPCADIEKGDTLNEALAKLCSTNREINTYEIDSVCYLQEGDSDPFAFQVTITPNFTHTTPVAISLALYDSSIDAMLTNIFGSVVSEVAENDTIILTYPSNGFSFSLDVELDELTFMVIDNLGNYSEEIFFDNGDLPKCEAP
jgi:hypothetical protein